MRTSEWIQIGFAAILALAAWIASLPARRRWTITALALIATATVACAIKISTHLPPAVAAVFRDWLTVALFLIPYWQTGQFFLQPNPAIERRLLAFDQRLLPGIARTSGTNRTRVGFILEMAYLSCYPLVPLGLLAIYITGQRSHVAAFWFIVLIATYLCYAITPFVPALPPRSLVNDPVTPANPTKSANKGRIFNRWILRHGSIHAISFPSAHVASAFAIAFILLRYSLPAGLLFLLLAIAISLGAVIGRYHYALDVLFGALVPLLVFFASYRYL
ncbi:phosphatase PAP2 family protein [Edaphobacter aggregans]|uniref:phosphatase PAP2 family protein n=1 Tax=Edaphobacter aggregans TaxID=570835 RepID=UPI00068BF576|nr:phosphatase PAP2 family protein [Edaphobacter aggregans]